jgi:hypothetical protein
MKPQPLPALTGTHRCFRCRDEISRREHGCNDGVCSDCAVKYADALAAAAKEPVPCSFVPIDRLRNEAYALEQRTRPAARRLRVRVG